MRLTLLCTCLLAVFAVVANPASARIVEIGKTAQDPVASCPSVPCYAFSRTTGYQVKQGAERAAFEVPANGKIVAWSIVLGKPGRKQTSFFDDMLGGEASAGIAILKPGKRLFNRVTGQSPLEKLEPYFGTTVQFPLSRALTVRKGYRVALTTPSWAPALAAGFGNDVSWRATRLRNDCNDRSTQSAQLKLRDLARYTCLYKTARLTYTATLVTSPSPPRP